MQRKPSDWDNEVKMNVLFSPFRDKNLNPKGWDQKMKFWSELIVSECVACDQAIIDVGVIKEKFRRNGRAPACLPTVVKEMLSSGQLQKLSDLENQASSDGWLSWGYKKLVKDPVGWGMKWWSQQEEPGPDEERYVIMEVIKSKACTLMERRNRLAQDEIVNIVEYHDLQHQYSDLCDSDVEFGLIMKQLCDTKQAVIQQRENNTKYVKFIQTKKTHKKEEQVTIDEKDIHVHKIHKAVSVVKKQIEALTEETKRLADEAVSYKKQGLMKLALSSMRKRKMAQNRIDKLTGSMDTLYDILYRIQQAESNEMIIRAIEGGSSVLKDLTSKTTADEVAGIMDNLADVTMSQEDIMNEISTASFVDEPSQDDLEEELSAILDESNSESRSAKSGLDVSDIDQELEDILKLDDELQLPDVPTHSPGQAQTKLKRQQLATH